MPLTTVGYTKQGRPVILTEHGRFDIAIFYEYSRDSQAPILVCRDEVTWVYGFTLVRSLSDMVDEWKNGKMEPFACLTDAECYDLLTIATSDMGQEEKNEKVQEILERNTFRHFGCGS